MTEVPAVVEPVARPVVSEQPKPTEAKPSSKLPVTDLLVWKKRAEILDAIKNNPTVLLIAGTGTGKTRGGAQIALEAIGEKGNMVMTENLRKATEMSAEIVAEDRGENVGDVVGVQNRYRRNVSDKTRLLFCPTQTLLNKMEHDPDLSQYDLVMVDEVHKESKSNEILLTMLKKIQEKRQQAGKPLKLILTSATMDEDKLKRNFQGAKTVEVPGETFPIDDKTWHDRRVPMSELPKAAAEKVKFAIDKGDPGNILVFLSGRAQIEEAQRALDGMGLKDTVVVPYFGGMSKEEQDAAVEKFGGKRVVVLATNAAQESLTWPIRVVVDTCTHKHKEYDPVTGKDYLVEGPAPLDHLKQRKGRVGRRKTEDGIPDKYYALTTESDWNSRQKHEDAEIMRTDITTEVLTLLATGQDPTRFEFINKPYPSHITAAYKRLEKLGALKDKKLTEKGMFMADLQLSVNQASLVAEGVRYGNIEDTAALAAMLEIYPDVFNTKNTTLLSFRDKYAHTKSDLIPLVHLLHTYGTIPKDNKKAWLKDHGLRPDMMRDVYDLYQELVKTAKSSSLPKEKPLDRTTALDMAIHHSFKDVTISGVKTKYLKVEGVGGDSALRIDKASVLSSEKKLSPFVSANIKTIAKDGVREGRVAAQNHTLGAEAQLLIRDEDKAKSPKSKVENQTSESPKVESQTPKDEQLEDKSQVKSQESEELPPPPPKPLKWWQKVGNWFKGLFGRLFG